MFPLSNRMVLLTSIGHAFIFSLAVSGAVQLVASLLGSPLSPEAANRIFFYSCVVTAPPAAYFKIARLMLPASIQQAS